MWDAESSMAEAYTIRLFVPAGDPEGIKIIELMNWTGVGIAFPRYASFVKLQKATCVADLFV